MLNVYDSEDHFHAVNCRFYFDLKAVHDIIDHHNNSHYTIQYNTLHYNTIQQNKIRTIKTKMEITIK